MEASLRITERIQELGHGLFDRLGKGVAARIGAVFLGFGHGNWMWIDTVSHARVAANQDELLKCGDHARGF